MLPFKRELTAAVVLGFFGTVASAAAAPTQSGKPKTVTARSNTAVARQATLDPARVVADQIRLERNGNIGGLLSKSLKAAYDAVPRDEDNLGGTVLGVGYDVPDRVVRVSAPRYDDAADPVKASATATLHYTNEDVPRPSFNRSIVVAFVREDGRWMIDDVHTIDPEGRRTGREVGLKRAFRKLSEERTRTFVERHAPRAGRNEMPDNRRSAP